MMLNKHGAKKVQYAEVDIKSQVTV